jgi:hypothetical protein
VRAGRGGKCGGVRRHMAEARRRGPRSCHRALKRPLVASMRSWSKCARNQAKKTAVPAITRTQTGRVRRGPHRCAGAGATVHVKVKEWREGDAYHTKTE